MARGPEAQLQEAVIATAQMVGWRVAHFRAAQAQSGRWLTPMAGDTGYPDLTMVKGDRTLFWELKSDTNYLSGEQKLWRDILSANPNVEYAVVRPREWKAGLVESALSSRGVELPQK